jgi:hypothetical protein
MLFWYLFFVKSTKGGKPTLDEDYSRLMGKYFGDF